MRLYNYTVQLIDPLFFSREGIGGARTPPYIHATAINHAITWAIGRKREDQAYIISDAGGGKNAPRYKNSRIDRDFYFTPARLKGSPNYQTEIVKGDREAWVQVSYGGAKLDFDFLGFNPKLVKQLKAAADGRTHVALQSPSEVLKAYRLFSIAPESVFWGFLYTDLDEIRFPKLIRLGSFRGLAKLDISARKTIGVAGSQYCCHPIDPLVQQATRGTAVPMLPYPIVDRPFVSETWEIRQFGQPAFAAALSDGGLRKRVRTHNDAAII
ncbi:MAG: hypothetical protein ACYC5F_05230 [Thermoleophilia bacterium]